MPLARRLLMLVFVVVAFLLGAATGTVVTSRQVAEGHGPPWAAPRPQGRARTAVLARAAESGEREAGREETGRARRPAADASPAPHGAPRAIAARAHGPTAAGATRLRC